MLAVAGDVVVILAGEAAATVAAGLVDDTSGDTTATGVLLDTDVDTRGVDTAETTGAPVAVVAFTMPAVDLTIPTVDTLAALDNCVEAGGAVDCADVTLATLTVERTGVGVETVAIAVGAAGLVAGVLTDTAVFKGCTLDVTTVVGTVPRDVTIVNA